MPSRWHSSIISRSNCATGPSKARFNQIDNMHHVATPADTAIIAPNSDTPYSILWLDLRAVPLVISATAITRDRY
jgi:hypothetical protein